MNDAFRAYEIEERGRLWLEYLRACCDYHRLRSMHDFMLFHYCVRADSLARIYDEGIPTQGRPDIPTGHSTMTLDGLQYSDTWILKDDLEVSTRTVTSHPSLVITVIRNHRHEVYQISHGLSTVLHSRTHWKDFEYNAKTQGGKKG
jgi:hypothetical protein